MKSHKGNRFDELSIPLFCIDIFTFGAGGSFPCVTNFLEESTYLKCQVQRETG